MARVRRVAARTVRGDAPVHAGRGRGRGAAHRVGQVGHLPGSRAGVARGDPGRVTADRPDARPGRQPALQGCQRGGRDLLGRGPGRAGGRAPQRRPGPSQAVVREPRAALVADVPGLVARRGHSSDRRGRGPLHLVVGALVPSRVRHDPDGRRRRGGPTPASGRGHRHGHHRSSRRRDTAARPQARRRPVGALGRQTRDSLLRGTVPEPQGPRPAGGSGGRGLPPPQRHRLRPHAQRHRAASRTAEQLRPPRPPLQRGHGTGGAPAHRGRLSSRRDRRRSRHQSLRTRHRQA